MLESSKAPASLSPLGQKGEDRPAPFFNKLKHTFPPVLGPNLGFCPRPSPSFNLTKRAVLSVPQMVSDELGGTDDSQASSVGQGRNYQPIPRTTTMKIIAQLSCATFDTIRKVLNES